MEIPLFKDLFARDTRGNLRVWRIAVESNDDGTAHIVSHSGVVDGNHTTSRRHIKSGKNVGRKNETTAFQQAISEARSMWQKKVDAGMLEDPDEAAGHEPVFPMLAHRFDDHSKKIRYPAFVQPKLDGMRCMARRRRDGTVTLLSRRNKPLSFLNHIRDAISVLKIPDNIVLDGELFTKKLTFEEIVGLCRKAERISDDERKRMLLIEYHIYDCLDLADKKRDFQNRTTFLKGALEPATTGPLKFVETRGADSEAETRAHYEDFYHRQGFEGAMVRNAGGPYAINKRSYDLQKIKEFEDAEFEVIGFKEATGNDSGTIVWICRDLENGKEFDVRTKTTREERARLFKEATEDFDGAFRGRKMTVQFQGRTNGGVPRFPVAIRFRDHQD